MMGWVGMCTFADTAGAAGWSDFPSRFLTGGDIGAARGNTDGEIGVPCEERGKRVCGGRAHGVSPER